MWVFSKTLCSFRHLSLGCAGSKSYILVNCDQLTSNTHTGASFTLYFAALENSIIKIHLVGWNDLLPEAFEPLQSWSNQQTRSSVPLRNNDKCLVQSDRPTPPLSTERSQGRWWHFSSLPDLSDADCGRTCNQCGLTKDEGGRAGWKISWLHDNAG